MTTNSDTLATMLLKQQRDRQKIVDELLGRSKWSRVGNWLPGLVAVGVIIGWSTWTGGRSEYGVLIALLVANLVELSRSQAQSARRMKAIATILDRSGTLERFVADSPAVVARVAGQA